MKFQIESKKGVASFQIGMPISNYTDKYAFQLNKGEPEEFWDDYLFFDEALEVYVNKKSGIIESIGCRVNCYLESTNLIGLKFDNLLILIDFKREKLAFEEITLSDGEIQTVYEIPSESMQVWVNERGRIVTIFIS